MPLTYVELFAGMGGLSLGLDRAGFRCLAHVELDRFARRTLEHNWPNVPTLADVRLTHGGELVKHYGPVDILSGGSPCQGLSVAGAGLGLLDHRSVLFFEQIRVWLEILAAQDSDCLFLWENVDGARSNNKGKDFAAVLSAIVGDTVELPHGHKWTRAGVVAGSAGVAAWRVLDAQRFGVPQRRTRVFVVGTRAGGVDPAEVLAIGESLRRNTPPSRREGDQTTLDFAGGPDADSDAEQPASGALAFSRSGFSAFAENPVAGTMTARNGKDADVIIVDGEPLQVAKPLLSHHPRRSPDENNVFVGGGVDLHNGEPIAFHMIQDPISSRDLAPSLGAKSLGMGVVAFSAKDSGADATFDVSPTLRAGTARSEATANGGVMPAVFAFKPSHFTRGKDGRPSSVFPPLTADADKGDQDPVCFDGVRPRRLLPVECERLMGWPDGFTDVVDERGKRPADSPRYRGAGNGVASPTVEWIGWQIRRVLGL